MMTTNIELTKNENAAALEDQLGRMLIRDLVEAYPQTMTILTPLGIDLCCGGGHPLGEALDLHQIPSEPVLRDVRILVESAGKEPSGTP